MITLDALHTTRNTALAIRRRHGSHYLFTVKGNAPETFQTLETIDWDRDATSRFCENDEKAHGRIEKRRIQVLQPLRGLINYPEVRQVFRVIRKRNQVKTGEKSIDVAYGMTSLPPEQADAEQLLALNRGHWVVENRNHRPRDTTFGEDACLMHTGHGPSNNALVNHTALAPIFHRGFRRVQAAVQHFAMDPGRSDPRGRRARLSSLPEPSAIATPPTVPRTLGSSGWVPAVAAPSGSKLVPSGRTGLNVEGHQHLITRLPSAKDPGEPISRPLTSWRTLHE